MVEVPDDIAFETHLRRKYSLYFDVAERLLGTARDMAQDRPVVFHEAFDGLAAFFFAKSYKTFAAIVLLARKGFGEDAAVLSRGLVENTTNLLYIAEEPETRAELYLDYEYVARNRYISMLESAGAFDSAAGASSPARGRLRQLYESVKSNYPNENLWSGKSIRQMADEVGLTSHYLFAYKYFSDMAHAAPTTVTQVLEPGEQEGLVDIAFGPNEAFVSEALIWSCDLFWRVLAKNNEVFVLEFETSLRDSAMRMREVFRGMPGR